MNISNKFKRHLLSGTFLILCTALSTGCGMTGGSHDISDLLGDERSVPEGAIVNFGNRHSPVLNPSTNRPTTANDEVVASESGSRAAPPVRNYASVIPSDRRVPVENQGILNGGGPATMSAPVAPVMAEPMPAPSAIASAPLPPAAPVAVAVTPTEISPPLVEARPAEAAPAEPVPVVASTAPAEAAPIVLTPPVHKSAESVAEAKAPVVYDENYIPPPVSSGDVSGKPSLASVPPAPEAPARDQSTVEASSLSKEQAQSEAAREQLMSNPQATVMTSPATGEAVGNAATASVPPATEPATPAPVVTEAAPEATTAAAETAPVAEKSKSEGGFGHWLHNLFHGDSSKSESAAPAATASSRSESSNVIEGTAPAFPPASQPAADTASAAVAVTPSDASSAQSAATADIAPLGSELPQPGASGQTPPFAVDTPAAQPASGVSSSASTAPDGTPIAITPPATASAPADLSTQKVPVAPAVAGSSSLPDVSELSGSPEQPVSLTPPSEGPAAARTLPDSRYKVRRDGDSDGASN